MSAAPVLSFEIEHFKKIWLGRKQRPHAWVQFRGGVYSSQVRDLYANSIESEQVTPNGHLLTWKPEWRILDSNDLHLLLDQLGRRGTFGHHVLTTSDKSMLYILVCKLGISYQHKTYQELYESVCRRESDMYNHLMQREEKTILCKRKLSFSTPSCIKKKKEEGEGEGEETASPLPLSLMLKNYVRDSSPV